MSKVNIIPYVLIWDGILTTFHKQYRRLLGLERYTEAYIQSVGLKRTFESISIDFRRISTLVGGGRDKMVEAAVEKLHTEKGECELNQSAEASLLKLRKQK